MVLLSVLDVVLVVLGGAGMLYQAVCIVISLFAKPITWRLLDGLIAAANDKVGPLPAPKTPTDEIGEMLAQADL